MSASATLPPALRALLDEERWDELAAALVALPGAELAAALDALVLVGPAAGAALERADARAPDRERKKQVRRAIHRLRSRGADVAPQAAPRSSVLRPLPQARVRAVASAIDPAGARIVWLATERSGGAELCEILVSDQAGVLRVERMSGRRRDVERFLSDLLAQRKLEAAEVDPDAARAWLRHCERAKSATAAGVDPALVRELVRGAESPTPGEQVRARLAPLASLAESESWLRARLEAGGLAAWLLTGPAIDEAVARLEDIERSPLVLSGLAERDRREQPLAAAAASVLGAEARERIARRLDETAALLDARGERSGASACLRVADAVREARDPLRVGFLQRLLELSIEGARRRRGGPGESPLIVPR